MRECIKIKSCVHGSYSKWLDDNIIIKNITFGGSRDITLGKSLCISSSPDRLLGLNPSVSLFNKGWERSIQCFIKNIIVLFKHKMLRPKSHLHTSAEPTHNKYRSYFAIETLCDGSRNKSSNWALFHYQLRKHFQGR